MRAVERTWASAVASAPARTMKALPSAQEQAPYEVARHAGMVARSPEVLLMVLDRMVNKAGCSSSLSAHTQLRRAQTGENVRFWYVLE